MKIYEPKQGKWSNSKIDFKIGYSSNYSFKTSKNESNIYYVLSNGKKEKSEGNTFLSMDHVLKIGTGGRGDEVKFKEPKQASVDLNEITAKMIEEINKQLETKLDAILEFRVTQSYDGDSVPYDTKINTPTEAIKTAKTALPSANRKLKEELQQSITDRFISVSQGLPIETISGFSTLVTNASHSLSCLAYGVKVKVNYIAIPKEYEDKPQVGIVGASINEFYKYGKLGGKIGSGHPKLAEGTLFDSTDLIGIQLDDDDTAKIETHNTVYVVKISDWDRGQPPWKELEKERHKVPCRQDFDFYVATVPFPNIPSAEDTDLWFWKRLLRSLGESSKQILLDASEQHPIQLEGWLLKPGEDLDKEFEGFMNYLVENCHWSRS